MFERHVITWQAGLTASIFVWLALLEPSPKRIVAALLWIIIALVLAKRVLGAKK